MRVYLITVSGELPLRSPKTRRKMYQLLVNNISSLLAEKGVSDFDIRVSNAKIVVRADTDIDLLDQLARVFGVLKVAEVRAMEFENLEELSKAAESIYSERVRGKKFAVRVKRRGTHSFTSLDAAREIGNKLYQYSAGVDLENPEVEVKVEIDGNIAYFIDREAEGPGGLPLCSEGRALLLFSGGFDSPVAAWMISKRGVCVDFLHYYMGSTGSTYNAVLVAKKLGSEWMHGYRPRLYVVDLTAVIEKIRERVPWSYRQVVLRAYMYIIAERLAKPKGYDAIATGESIGQASSQTLKNLAAIEKAVGPAIPILRPLLTFDKEEIIELSRRIGLYELSSKVAEACAIAPRHVVTKASSEELRKMLGGLGEGLADEAIRTLSEYDAKDADPAKVVEGLSYEIDEVPEGSILVDVRDKEAYQRFHLPNAIHLSQLNELEIDKSRPIVFYCDSGSLSNFYASIYRKKGFRAFSLRGGLSRCRG